MKSKQRNFVFKHLFDFNKSKTEIDKKKEQKPRPKKFKNTGDAE